MENLKIYEIENSYIDYIVPFAPHLFHNKKENQETENIDTKFIIPHKTFGVAYPPKITLLERRVFLL